MTALPLAGLKVLDLTRVLSGPWATMTLADLGAEVWKVENVQGGDDTRAWSVPSWKGVSTYFLCANRGKQSVALDMKAAEGRAIVQALAARADILVENFRPGTAERLGLGWEEVHAANPRAIYCSISGYGQEGPEADRPGYDFIMQAESGLMSVTGEKDGPPLRLGVAFTDVVAGMIATQSILAALYQRHDTGEGQRIDVTLWESALNLLVNLGTGYLNAGVEPVRYGNAHPNVVPYQVFPAADAPLALAVGNDRMFADFCEQVIARPDLAADPRFRTARGRALNRGELIPVLTTILAARPAAHWLDACRAASVPAGRVQTVAEALRNPTVAARGIVETLEHPELGTVALIRPAHGLAAQKDRPQKAPPLLGEDTAAILSGVLGYGADRIAALEAAGIIACHPPKA